MSDRRFYDPFREVVSEEKGPGCDRVTLRCGHEVVVNHRAAFRTKQRCHHPGCRQWLQADR